MPRLCAQQATRSPMPPDPRELVDRLDALLAEKCIGTEFPLDELRVAYPALRAAVLRVAELEAALRDAVRLLSEVRADHSDPDSQNYNQCEGDDDLCGFCFTAASVAAALAAPQGEEQGT